MKSNPLKSILKMAASQIRVDIYQRLMAYAIFNSAFKELASVPHFYTQSNCGRNVFQMWPVCKTRSRTLNLGCIRGLPSLA